PLASTPRGCRKPRCPSPRSRLLIVASLLNLSVGNCLLAFGQTLGPPETVTLTPIPAGKPVVWDLKHFPKGLDVLVSAVFDGTAPQFIKDNVAFAMKLDTFQIEMMTTDDTILNRYRWQAALDRRRKIMPIIENILNLPEDKIDVWNVSMMLAKDAYPDLD